MNTEIIGLLENINILYDRKNNINALVDLINIQGQQEIESTYGLFAVPDDQTIFGDCDIVYNGPDYGGAHITIVNFGKTNKDPIDKILKDINVKYDKNPRWTLNPENIDRYGKNYNIKNSKTLNTLARILNANNIDTVFNNVFSIYCPHKKLRDISHTHWSLMIIEKNGNNITWLDKTKIPLYNMD